MRVTLWSNNFCGVRSQKYIITIRRDCYSFRIELPISILTKFLKGVHNLPLDVLYHSLPERERDTSTSFFGGVISPHQIQQFSMDVAINRSKKFEEVIVHYLFPELLELDFRFGCWKTSHKAQ